MPSAPTRAFLGFIAAAIAVLTFHQGLVAALHALGVIPMPPYRANPIPPFGVPAIVNLCFWGGLYGAMFGLLAPRFILPLWFCGIVTGIVAALVAMFVVSAIKGQAIAHGWQVRRIALSLLIDGFWGLGLGLILPIMLPRRHRHRRHARA